MVVIFIVLVILSAVLAMGVIMLQDEHGEGLGGIFGGGSGSAFGSRSGNMLTRITSILIAVFLLCTLILAILNKSSAKEGIIEAARKKKLENNTQSTWYIDTTKKDTADAPKSILGTTDTTLEKPADLVGATAPTATTKP